MLPSSSNNNIFTTPQLPSASSSTPSGNNGMIPSFQSNNNNNTSSSSSVDSQQQQHQYSSHLQPTFSNHPPYHSIHSTASNGPGLSHHQHHHGHHQASLQPPIPIMNGNQKIPNANNRFVFPTHPSMLMMSNPSQHPYMPPHHGGVMPSSSTAQQPPSQYSQEVVSNSRTIPPNVNNIPMNTTVKYSNSTIMNNKYSTTIADNSIPTTTPQESYISTTVPSTALPVWQNLVSEMVNPTSKKPKNELPLARIKKIMKSDEEVRTKTMISAEAPVLFAKACEMFIIELTLHAWVHTEESKRRTLQRNDIAAAIGKTDIFDFLIDIVPRENEKPATNSNSHQQSSHSHHQHASNSAGKGVSATASYHHNQQTSLPQQQQLIDPQEEHNTVEEEIDDEDGFQIDDEDDTHSDDEFEPPQQDITPTKNEDVSKLLLPSLDPKNMSGENSIKFVPGLGVIGSSQKQVNIERETSAILVDAPELTSEPSQFLDDSQTFLPLDNQ